MKRYGMKLQPQKVSSHSRLIILLAACLTTTAQDVLAPPWLSFAATQPHQPPSEAEGSLREVAPWYPRRSLLKDEKESRNIASWHTPHHSHEKFLRHKRQTVSNQLRIASPPDLPGVGGGAEVQPSDLGGGSGNFTRATEQLLEKQSLFVSISFTPPDPKSKEKARGSTRRVDGAKHGETVKKLNLDAYIIDVLENLATYKMNVTVTICYSIWSREPMKPFFKLGERESLKGLTIKFWEVDIYNKKKQPWLDQTVNKKKRFLLPMLGRASFRPEFPKHDYYMYLEDDIWIPWPAFVRFAGEADDLWTKHGSVRVFTRVECRSFARYCPPSDYVLSDCYTQTEACPARMVSDEKHGDFIDIQYPYAGSWVYTKAMFTVFQEYEFFEMPKTMAGFEKHEKWRGAPKGSEQYGKMPRMRERAAYGMRIPCHKNQAVKAKYCSFNGQELKYVLPLTPGSKETGKLELDPVAAIRHLPNNFAQNPHTLGGKLHFTKGIQKCKHWQF